jgi:hypothetical protein
MQYVIFRNGVEVVRVKPLETSELVERKQQDSFVRLDFTSDTLIDLRVGDYITHPRTQLVYTMREVATIMERPRYYSYEVTFKSLIHQLSEVKALLYTVTEDKTYIDYTFSLTGTAATFLQYITETLQRAGITLQVGTARETDTTTLFFNNWTVMEAIQQMSETLGFDWWLENDTVLHFDTKQTQLERVLMTGRLNGFTQLTRTKLEDSDLCTVVYGFGSTQNLPPRTGTPPTYDGVTLEQNRLSFGTDSRLERNVDKYGIRESVQEFDIKPSYTGTVENTLSITEFIDTAIDFDINEQLMSGIVPKVVFLSGILSGMTFQINYATALKRITLLQTSDEAGVFPNSVAFPSVGDVYTLVDLAMPQSYIDNAVERLREATQDYLDKNSEQQYVYEGILDEEFVRMYTLRPFLGDIVRVVAPLFALDGLFEIKELVQSITIPSRFQIKFGFALPKGLRFLLKSINFTTSQEIYNIQRTSITNNDITNRIGGETPTWEQL